MFVSANSIGEAIQEAERIFKCDRKRLKVYTVKPPNKLWGIFRIPGQYKIEPDYSVTDLSENKEKDGYIEIVSGKAIVTDPLPDGKYASIFVDDPQVDVYVNGNKVFGAAVVTSSDRIEFKAVEIEPVTKVSARLSADKMQAILEITKIPGKKYFVRDAKRSNIIFICSDFAEIQPVPATLDQCLEELEKLNVDPRLINKDKIMELIDERDGGTAVVAEGIRPINGISSKIKFFFRNTSYRNPDFDTEKKVDFLSHTIIPTVNVGDVLAVKVNPVIPGRDGLTVTGDVIKAKEGRDVHLRAGNGTVLLENGTKVVAVSPGRPLYERGIISVVPILVIPHDVDIRTGNVRFDGDIIIRGNIDENLSVFAGGDITVYGNIYRANVRANGNIRVHGNIINSNVSAGLNMLNYLVAVPKLKQVFEVVKEYRGIANLSDTPRSRANIKRKLLEAIINKKDVLNSLMREIRKVIKLSKDDENIELIMILEDIKRTLTGINAKCIEDPGQIKTLYMEINDYIQKIEELYGRKTDVIFEYGQNSFIQANGNIVIAGRGCYQTNLIAKNAILFNKTSSVVRGGLLIAGNCIKMGVVGSPTGISTYCRVLAKSGKIEAVCYYSNTVLNIGDSIRVVDSNFSAAYAKNKNAI